MKNDRLFQILYLLMGQEKFTAPQLADRLEVSVRTVYRDVESLSMAGVPVCTMAGKGGGISLLPGFTFDKSLLTEGEQDQILLALQTMRAAGREVDPLLKKMGGVFQKKAVDWISVDFSRWGYHQDDTRQFEQIKTAILERRLLEFVYWSVRGGEASRIVEPVRLAFKDKSWYLQAYCKTASDYRTFKFSRIHTVKILEETFEMRSQELSTLDTESMSVEECTCLKLLFVPEAAFRVYDEFDRKQIFAREDGFLEVSVCWHLDDWVLGYVLSFGDRVQILDPPCLLENMKAYVGKIYNHYKT